MGDQVNFSGYSGWGGGTLEQAFGGAMSFGVLQVPNAANTLETVPTDTLQSMSPVTDTGSQSWSGFWQDLTKGVLGYAIAKDAAQAGITGKAVPGATVPDVATATARPARAGAINPLVLVALVVGGVLLVRG